MSLSQAEELRQHNVAVNVLLPGATRTERSDEIAEARRAPGI
jgi:short-subunit dehydrogenase